MITRVHHVGVVVRHLEEAYDFWRGRLGLSLGAAAEVPDQGVRAALLECGAAEIELLEPTRPDTGVARFLARRGEGLHHLCLESDDVEGELERLVARGVGLIDRSPRAGLAGRVAFLHPRAGAGVLLELATPPPRARPDVPAPEGFPATPGGSQPGLRGVTIRVGDLTGALDRYGTVLDRGPAGFRRLAGCAVVEVGGVALALMADSEGREGLAGLELDGPDLGAGGWLRTATREPGGALRLPTELTHGVPLCIGRTAPEERGARP